jgi:membrane-bound lytic murein transglycosylase A
LLVIGGCFYYLSSWRIVSSVALKKVGWWDRPYFSDNLKSELLHKAIEKNFEYLKRLSPSKIFNCGSKQYSLEDVKESFRLFISILNESKDEKEFNRRIYRNFDIYRSIGRGKNKKVLFTGYYEPIFEGSRERTEVYKYPIYSKPEDMIEINLGDFMRNLKGKRIIGRIHQNKVVPYYERRSIDQLGSLAGNGIEIAWLADPIDAFFLHIQGSGIIKTIDGNNLNVHYAGKNGRRYRSIGRLLIEKGKIPKKAMSMQSIRKYLESHPEEMDKILFYNESYVFFNIVEQGPIGSIGVQLTSGRSIASDSKIFPKGGLAFIETEFPVTDEEGRVKGWEKISRFVVDQDTGGAIKGPGRIDIFFGTGDKAGELAGPMNREGELYYLFKKK